MVQEVVRKGGIFNMMLFQSLCMDNFYFLQCQTVPPSVMLGTPV